MSRMAFHDKMAKVGARLDNPNCMEADVYWDDQDEARRDYRAAYFRLACQIHIYDRRQLDTMEVIPRHKVFVSFHSNDQDYKDKFVDMLGDRIVDRSVGDG